MGVIDRTKDGVALVVDEDGRLVGTITDGNVRRYVLGNGDLAAACTRIIERAPITAPLNASIAHITKLLATHRLLQVPLVDADGRPQQLWSLRDLLPQSPSPALAVIMAGGEGKRLWPLTKSVPKPMVEISGRPLLEQIIQHVVEAGITSVYLAVNYRADIIENYFGDGQRFGLHINYLREKEKMGTAGALTLLPERPSVPLLVMNGDVVTSVPYQRLLDWHFEHRSTLTVAAVEYHAQVPFGVLACEGHRVLGVTEKPEHSWLCNGGMYVLEPSVLDMLVPGQACDMTDVLAQTVAAGLPVSAFPIHEEWVDVGRREDLQRAQEVVSL